MKIRLNNNRGSNVVEFALVSLLFIILIFGIVDFGRYFFVEQTIQFATREGMRLALVGGTINNQDRPTSIAQTIKDKAKMGVDPSKLTIYIYPVATDYSDPTNWQSNTGTGANAGSGGDFMRVKTQYTYKFLTPLVGTFFSAGQRVIEAQGTYRNELF